MLTVHAWRFVKLRSLLYSTFYWLKLGILFNLHIKARIAQLGERQTEDLKVAHRIYFLTFCFAQFSSAYIFLIFWFALSSLFFKRQISSLFAQFSWAFYFLFLLFVQFSSLFFFERQFSSLFEQFSVFACIVQFSFLLFLFAQFSVRSPYFFCF